MGDYPGVLEKAQLAWVPTVRADGRPHVTPLVAVWLDEAVHFTTGPSEQKAVNLVRNPHVVMTTGCTRWDEGLDVMIEGKAERVTDRATLERLAAAWATKWDGQWRFGMADGGFTHRLGWQGPRRRRGKPGLLLILMYAMPSKLLGALAR